MDATYRGELREINELNHARFEAKLEQGLGTLEARFEAKLELGLGTLEARVGAKIDQGLAVLEAKLERRLGEQTRWFFIAWASLLVTIIGLSTRR